MSKIVVRVRSDVGVERSIKETLHMLNLTKVNHAVIIPDNPQYKGMRKKPGLHHLGRCSSSTVESMLSTRGRMSGDKPLTDDIVAESSDYKNIKDLAKAIADGDATVKDVPGLKQFSDFILLVAQKAGVESKGPSPLVVPLVQEEQRLKHSLKG